MIECAGTVAVNALPRPLTVDCDRLVPPVSVYKSPVDSSDMPLTSSETSADSLPSRFMSMMRTPPSACSAA